MLMVSMTVSKSVGRDSSSLATEVINFYVNIKLLCRSSSEAERRIANSEVVISKFIYGLKRIVVGSGFLRILVIHFLSKEAYVGSSPTGINATSALYVL